MKTAIMATTLTPVPRQASRSRAIPGWPAGRTATLGSTLLQGVPGAYAAIFFSRSEKLGWWLLAVTLLAPDMGLAGLGGAVMAGVLGWCLGFDREQIRSGSILFNSMLACNTVAWLHHGYGFSPGLLITLWFSAACGALILSVGAGAFFSRMFGLGAHSFPAVVVGYILYFLAWSLHGPFQITAAARGDLMDLTMAPGLVRAVCQGFGAMLFMPLALPGLLIMVGVAVHSRLTLIAALAGFIAGFGGMQLLGFHLEPVTMLWCGFNFLFCGVAIAVGYYTPSRASLALAVIAAFLCAPVAVALATALRYFELPASALPANLVVMALVYALRQRQEAGLLLPNQHPGRGPEVSARLQLLGNARFPYLNTTALALPANGERLITQGFAGSLTHRGPWRHALDFEVREDGAAWRADGSRVEDFATFGVPVLAPCDGLVVRVVSSVPDNAPGANNPDANWGNYVMLLADSGSHVLLAHLQQGTVTAMEGRRVVRGEPLGHCGNSGRSPIPHLHVHVQETALLGAATKPFCLAHFLSRAEDPLLPWTYHTAGVPVEGETVAPCVFDAALFTTIAGWLPGEYRWQVTTEDRGTWEETLLMDFDETGCFRVRSRRYAAGFRAFLRDGAFFCTEFDGPGQSVAALLALGLSRVPSIIAPHQGVIWHDAFSSVPFAAAGSRWLHETLDPFTGPALLRYRHTFDQSRTAVICRLQTGEGAEPQAPREVRVTLAPARLAGSLEARLVNDRMVRAALVHYQVHAAAD